MHGECRFSPETYHGPRVTIQYNTLREQDCIVTISKFGPASRSNLFIVHKKAVASKRKAEGPRESMPSSTAARGIIVGRYTCNRTRHRRTQTKPQGSWHGPCWDINSELNGPRDLQTPNLMSYFPTFF